MSKVIKLKQLCEALMSDPKLKVEIEKLLEEFRSYLSKEGEGNTVGTQLVTAINKVAYRFYNDGEVYGDAAADADRYYLWLEKIPELRNIFRDREYYNDTEKLILQLAKVAFSDEVFNKYKNKPKTDSIYG